MICIIDILVFHGLRIFCVCALYELSIIFVCHCGSCDDIDNNISGCSVI